jgi:hypothetical protein
MLELDSLAPRVVLLPSADAALQAGPVQLTLQLRTSGSCEAQVSGSGVGAELPLRTKVAVTSVDAFLPTAVAHWQERPASSSSEQAFEVAVELQSLPSESGTLTVGRGFH